MQDESFKRTGRSMFIITWIIAFALVFTFFYYYTNQPPPEYSIKGGVLTIPVDKSGHYLIKGKLNNKEVIFLIDTGATSVAIPQNLADSLGLQSIYPVTMSTAGGEVQGYLTRVDTLTFGDFTLHNVKAVIGPDMSDNQILLGMNVLSHFVISQENKQLIIKTKER